MTPPKDARANPSGWAAAVERLVFANPLYQLTLSGAGRPPPFAQRPRATVGDPARGAALIADGLRIYGSDAAFGAAAWRSARADAHGFAAIADLAALGGDQAAAVARALIADWLDAHAGWTQQAWAPGALGLRLRNWIGYLDFFSPASPAPPDRGPDGDLVPRTTFSSDVALGLLRQARHLARRPSPAAERLDALDAASGLAVAACACAPLRPQLDRAFDRLARAADAQIAPDGGHWTRSPHAALRALDALSDALNAARIIKVAPPAAIRNAMDRIAPQLQAWRHGDGGFGLLAGGDIGRDAAIAATLAAVDHTGRPQQSAPYIGVHRLDARRAAVLIDVGAAAPGWDEGAHAAALAIEMSAGPTRLIVSCGAPAAAPAAWRAAARGSAAHSGLTIADVNVAEVLETGGFGRRPDVTVERGEDADGYWVAAAHNGYADRFGRLHQRALRLSRDGLALSGRDRLVGGIGCAFAIRFHLHPDVRASLSGGGAAVLLRPQRGDSWRFSADGAALALEPSLYWGDGAARRTTQIVLSGDVPVGDWDVAWRFLREARRR